MRDITEKVVDGFYWATGRFRLRVIEARTNGTRQVWLTDEGNHVATFHGETFEQALKTGERVVCALGWCSSFEGL